MCAVICHRATQTEPIWIIIVGPPRSGKTEAITAFKKLPESYMVGNLSPKAFISGYREGVGLLERLDAAKKHLLLLKDLTTLLSQRQQDQAEVVAALREIADGSYTVDNGKGQGRPWEGKLTILAGVTQEIHRAWGGFAGLGPRFMFLNWRPAHQSQISKHSLKQVGGEQRMREHTRDLIADILSHQQCFTFPTLTSDEENRVVNYSCFAARIRQNVVRGYNHQVIDVDQPEGSGVLAKTFFLIARARAAIYGRTALEEADWQLVERIMHDSTPPYRMSILTALIAEPKLKAELRHEIGAQETTFRRRIEDLREMGLIAEDEFDPHTVHLTDEGRETVALLPKADLCAPRSTGHAGAG